MTPEALRASYAQACLCAELASTLAFLPVGKRAKTAARVFHSLNRRSLIERIAEHRKIDLHA
jgi:hypothetical protein